MKPHFFSIIFGRSKLNYFSALLVEHDNEVVRPSGLNITEKLNERSFAVSVKF